MASGYKLKDGRDFDSIFELGNGGVSTLYKINNGSDIGNRFLAVSSGSAFGITGYKNKAGQDLGNLFCKLGSKNPYPNTTKCNLTIGNNNYSYGYIKNQYGSLTPNIVSEVNVYEYVEQEDVGDIYYYQIFLDKTYFYYNGVQYITDSETEGKTSKNGLLFSDWKSKNKHTVTVYISN